MLRLLLAISALCIAWGASLIAAGGILALDVDAARPVRTAVQAVARPVLQLTHAETELYLAINRYRAQHGRRPVRPHAALMRAARGRTNSTPFTGHRVNGQSPWRAARQCGWRGNSCGENLAWGSSTPDEAVFNQWAHSPGHNRNQLGNWSYVGVGVRGRTYVAIFGR